MKHPQADPEFALSELLDGALPIEQTEALHAKLASQPELRHTFDRLAQVDALVREAAEPLPEVDWRTFRQSVAGAIDEVDRTRHSWRSALRRMVPVAVAASIALILFLSPEFRSKTPSTTSEPRVEVTFLPPAAQSPLLAALDPQGADGVDVRFEPPGAATATRPAGAATERRGTVVVTVAFPRGAGRTANKAGPPSVF